MEQHNFIEKSVVNLSNFELNEHHISLLSRGLKFCPTPACPDPGLLREDLDRFHTRLRQIAYFENRDGFNDNSTSFISTTQPVLPNPMGNTDPFKHQKFRLKSTWRAPPGPVYLEAMIACNDLQFNTRPEFKPQRRKNLTLNERLALKELTENKTIIIKPADKGSAVVVMNRQDYLKEGFKQLSDTKYYMRLDHEPTLDFHKEVENFVQDMWQNTEIDDSVQSYLMRDTKRTPQLYLLPKIHKGINPPPGRPIISANGCPTEKISEFVDHFLNPTLKHLRSFVKDTTHFLKLIYDLGQLPPNCTLVTMDVSSLYTNIPIEEGINTARNALMRYRSTPNIKPTNESLITLLSLVLKKNNFQFNGCNYLQTGGTAMGTKVAPSFAITYMGAFEEEHVYTYRLQPLIYLRYIDDIFIIWQHGEEELEQFFTHVNSCSTHIKFTTETSKNNIAFLDSSVVIRGCNISTTLYTKPTDSHNYLYYDSAHPQRCKDSIPYSQFLRIRRICTYNDDFDQNILELCKHFLRRKYPLELLHQAATLARGKVRSTLLEPTDATPDDTGPEKVFLITTYHPHDQLVPTITRRNWHILGKNQTTDFLHQRKLTCGYRRPKNLRDILCKATVQKLPGDELVDPEHVTPPTTVTTPMAPHVARQTSILDFVTDRPSTSTGVPARNTSLPNTGTRIPLPTQPHGGKNRKRGYSFCPKNDCRYCRLLNKTGTIQSKTTGAHHTTMRKISCRSSNLIYAVTCNNCGIQYVGQTLLRIKDRFLGHLGDINNANQDKPLGKHFSQGNHRGIDDIRITVLEFIKMPPRSPQAITIRHRVERNWTQVLRTLAPQGLNLENPKQYTSHLRP